MSLSKLESKIDELIALCDELQHTESSLKGQRDQWREERRQLLEKNNRMRTKIEAIITRLKSLEQS